jgi:RecG-like helicase
MSHASSSLHSLQTLRSLSGDQVQALSTIGITNLGDLLAYQPLRAAQYLRAARDKLLRREEVLAYVDQTHRSKSLDELLAASHSPKRTC